MSDGAQATNLVVDPSNADALRAWDGGDGAYWAEHDLAFDATVARFDDPLFTAAGIRPGDRVLDVGCGSGRSTRIAARAAAPGAVLGVDLSTEMIEVARRRTAAEGLTNVDYRQADAQAYPFGSGSFDVAVSRTGAMFFGDPAAAFTNIGRALRDGGRLALLVWQEFARNAWIAEFTRVLAAGRTLPPPPAHAPGPFSLADPGRVRGLLSDAGYADVSLDGVEAAMFFGADTEAAFRFVAGFGYVNFLLSGLDETARREALAALRASVDAHATAEGVLYPAAAWVVTARRGS